MRTQEKSFSCGPAVLRAIFYMLGQHLEESDIRKAARTTTDGTNEKGLQVALESFEYSYKEYNQTNKDSAWVWLKNQLAKGKPVILCVNNWDHWVAAIGIFGSHILVYDPAKNRSKNQQYSTIKVYRKKHLLKYWAFRQVNNIEKYYAISVGV